MSSRPFQVMVDAASEEEPPNAYFGTLKAAWERTQEPWMEKWLPYTWIQDISQKPPITYMKDGKQAQ